MTAPAFERAEAAGGPLVRGFSGSRFMVEGRGYDGLLMTPEAAAPWEAPSLSALRADHVAPLLALRPPPEFLILGTGAAMAFAPRDFVAALEAQGVGVEAMDSRAAARTWGLLRGEGRWIVAALMPL
jgi:uncharacterized protein